MHHYPEYPWFTITYTKWDVETALWSTIYTQVNKKLGIQVSTFRELMLVLDVYTLQQVKENNTKIQKGTCVIRPHVRALLIDQNWLLISLHNEFLIGTNNIGLTSENENGVICPRKKAWKANDRTICVTQCWRMWCAEKSAIQQALSNNIPLTWTKILLFWHTEWPCHTCCQLMEENGLHQVIIWSLPLQDNNHKHFDEDYFNSWYKMITATSSSIA